MKQIFFCKNCQGNLGFHIPSNCTHCGVNTSFGIMYVDVPDTETKPETYSIQVVKENKNGN